MKIHNLKQGSPEWNALRASHNTASEASAMMGKAKNTSRNELLRLKATGSEKEFSAWAQRFLLDKGHAVEKQALPIAQGIVGEDLYPCTGTSDEYPNLLASFDGLTMLGNIAWECKSWNEEKAAEVRRGLVPECDYWQVVQQLLVSGAEKCLYMVTDGTEKKTVHVWFAANESLFVDLLAAWALFDEDLAKYEHVEAAPQVVATPVQGLPAINYQLNGLALTSNLKGFRAAAEKLVADSKLPLNTDQEFADREALCKSFGEAETKIRLLKEQVLGEFKDVDAFTRELGEIGELIRQARLAGEKQVDARKKAIKADILSTAEGKLAAHIAELNKGFTGGVVLPRIIDNFAAAMKNKRNLTSMQDAVDAVLAEHKLEANAMAAKITANLELLREKANDFLFLFRDRQELVQKDGETLALLIDSRIREHKESEEQKERDRLAEVERLAQEQRQREHDEQLAEEQAIHTPVPQATVAPQATQPRSGVAGGHADGDLCRQPEPREADLLDTSPIPVGTATRVEVIDMRELVKAVAAGQVPLSVLNVDLAVLGGICEVRGQAMPGTRWSKA